jgi:superfamily II DNA helicase RecQ
MASTVRSRVHASAKDDVITVEERPQSCENHVVDSSANDSDGDGPDHESAYERTRRLQIAANNAKLRELGLDGQEFKLSVPAIDDCERISGSKRKTRASGRRSIAEHEPTRRSGRVKRQAAADIFIDDENDASGRVKVGGASAAEEVARMSEFDVNVMPVDVEDLLEVEREVYEVIRLVRNTRAKEMERSMFIVCNDRSMCEMVRALPSNNTELMECYGMGAGKVSKHGELLLGALAPHVDRLRQAHADATAEVVARRAARDQQAQKQESATEDDCRGDP